MHTQNKKDNISNPGEVLKNARTARKISLDFIADETRIPRDRLEALEKSDFGYFPGSFYARSFLRAYSEYLGVELDPDIIIPSDGPMPIGPGIKSPRADADKKTSRPAQASSVSLKRIISAVALAAVLAAAFMAAVLNYPGISKRLSGILTKPDTSGQQAVLPEAADAPERVMVKAGAEADTWLRVVSDGRVVFEGIMRSGAVRHWQADDELTLRIGMVSFLNLGYRTGENQDYRPVNIRKGAMGGVNQISFVRGETPEFLE